jgi:hypothetical protein
MATGIFERILRLADRGDILVSDHGYDELAADGILVADVVQSLSRACVVQEYPDYIKGPCVLVLQQDRANQPIHVVWGIATGTEGPAVLVTAYRPDPRRWTEDFLRRQR